MKRVITNIGKMLEKSVIFALTILFLNGCCIAGKKANLDEDHTLCEFPMQAGETDDAPRILRAIQATPNGVLTIPRGTYRIATPIVIDNNCSLEMNKNTILQAGVSVRKTGTSAFSASVISFHNRETLF